MSARDVRRCHGPGTPEYNSWGAMIQRCTNPRHAEFHNYGGRGISVCAEWRGRGGFARFLAHVGRKPSPRHSIDRVDVDECYEPGNVRWSTPMEQANNMRVNRLITANGRTQTLSEWARETGLSVVGILNRIDLRGWTEDAAVTTPRQVTRGAKCGSRLTESAVREMRVEHSRGESPRELACRYDVSPSAVSLIVRGKTWKHVE